MSTPARREAEPLELPNLCDKSAVLFAVNEVVQAFTQRRIKCSEAEVLIKGLKLASHLMAEIEKDLDRFSEPPTFFSTLPASQSQSRQNASDLDHPATDDVPEPAPENIEELPETPRNATPDQFLVPFQSRQADPAGQPGAHLLALAATAEISDGELAQKSIGTGSQTTERL